jgi:hypothetical protein
VLKLVRQSSTKGLSFFGAQVVQPDVRRDFCSRVLVFCKCLLQVVDLHECTGLFKMIVWVLTTCHTQYT